MTANAVTNAVLNDRLRLRVPVAIGYDDDLDAVARILADAAVDHPTVLEHPEPTARIVDLEDVVRVVALFWIADPDRSTYGRVRSEYAREIVDRLEREGIDLGAATPSALEESIGIDRGPASRAVRTNLVTGSSGHGSGRCSGVDERLC
ncbi:hypothetical protein [Natrinema versiforme]|uniref:hypothetical protein n=1 Tax=Natrinema versiforme TaxID=88724 RepID=UPI002D218587|nr:hypothetical protein [Natrinema versiforme]